MTDPEVLIVAYGRADLVDDAIRGLGNLRIIIVDNSSHPAVEQVAQRYGATYIDPRSNLGFAAGVNRGLREITAGRDVLLLNPDARILSDDVSRLQERLHAVGPRLAAVAPVQRDAQGNAQRIEWPLPSPGKAWSEAIGLQRLAVFRRSGRHFLTGSILLLNANAIRHVGDFDTRFFLYAEETDWQRRALNLGWGVELVNTVTGFHIGGATSTNESVRETHFHASTERFIRKWYGPEGWLRYRVAVVFGSLIRSLLLRGDDRALRRRQVSLYLRGPIKMASRLPPH